VSSASANQGGACNIELVVDERRDALDKAHSVRLLDMALEGGLVAPARVDAEEKRVADRAIGVDCDAACLAAGRTMTSRIAASTAASWPARA
jgi:hypothetical protein